MRVLVAYVEQRKLSRPLTVDEILQWSAPASRTRRSALQRSGTLPFSTQIRGRTGNIFFFRQSSPDTALIGKRRCSPDGQGSEGTEERSVISLSAPVWSGTFLFFAAKRYPGSFARKREMSPSALEFWSEKGECPYFV